MKSGNEDMILHLPHTFHFAYVISFQHHCVRLNYCFGIQDSEDK